VARPARWNFEGVERCGPDDRDAIATLRVDPTEQVRARKKQNRHAQLPAIDSARAHTATWR
jgi:hypothetical protein